MWVQDEIFTVEEKNRIIEGVQKVLLSLGHADIEEERPYFILHVRKKPGRGNSSWAPSLDPLWKRYEGGAREEGKGEGKGEDRVSALHARAKAVKQKRRDCFRDIDIVLGLSETERLFNIIDASVDRGEDEMLPVR